MPLGSTFTITYGGFTVGGSGNYELHNPYVIDKAFTSLRLSFSVVVTASSHSGLKSASDALEDAFRKRDQNLTISLGGSSWTYTFGSNILNTTATAVKSGDPQADRGVSRMYNCTVLGELPAEDQDGLRDLQVGVRYEPGRQQFVSMTGTYTALSGTKALAKYKAEFDSEAATILTAIDGSATWELVSEDVSRDRNDHVCTFSRQYAQLIYDQSSAGRDDDEIVAAQVVFTVLSSYPGDGAEGITRLHRVQAVYTAYADITENDNLREVADKAQKYLLKQFEAEFDPKVFAIEDTRNAYEESSKKFSLQVTLVFQTSNGTNVVEITKGVSYREERMIDYTYVHDGDELSAYADPGWITLDRITTRTVIVVGEDSPSLRIAANENSKIAPSMDIQAPQQVQQSGWNRIGASSQATPQFVGDPTSGNQIRLTVLNEEVIERFNKAPKEGGPISGDAGLPSPAPRPPTAISPGTGPSGSVGVGVRAPVNTQ